MDLGALNRHHQPGYLEELVRSYVAETYNDLGLRWIAEATVCVRSLCCNPAELGDKGIVFAREEVVQKAQANSPIVRKGSCFLSRPFGIDGVTGAKYRQISRPRSSGYWKQKKFCGIGRITLHTLAGGAIEAVQLRGIPPGSIGIAHRLRRASHVGAAIRSKCARRGILRDVSFIHPVVRTAAQFLDVLRCERLLDIVHELGCATYPHILSLIVPLLKMREPVVGHELDPISRENVEEGRLLVVAVSSRRIARKAIASLAFVWVRLDASQ